MTEHRVYSLMGMGGGMGPTTTTEGRQHVAATN